MAICRIERQIAIFVRIISIIFCENVYNKVTVLIAVAFLSDCFCQRREGTRMKKKKKRNWRNALPIYCMMLPGIIYLCVNNYAPMFGLVIAFKKINWNKGILGSDWAGFANFRYLFASSEALNMTKNTVLYNLAFIVVGTVVSITVAILLNEITSKFSSRLYQTLILLPYMISWVIVSYLVFAFLSAETGMVNQGILAPLGREPIVWYQEKRYWPFLLVLAYLWKSVGFSMVIYLSSIVGISKEYYEAARIDGAGKWKQIRFITLPLLKATVITLLIMNIGSIFYSDFGLFYQVPRNSGALYDVTQTIDTYVYNALMQQGNISLSSAAGFYQSIVGFALVLAANAIVRRYSRESALF